MGIGPALNTGIRSGLYGYVDIVDSNGVQGWLLDAGQPDSRLTVTVYLGETQVGMATCQYPRSDIIAVLNAPCVCGFQIHWDWKLLREILDELPATGTCSVEVRAPNGSPIEGAANRLDVAELHEWVETALPLAPLSDQSSADSGMRASAREVVSALRKLRGVTPNVPDRDDQVRVIAFYLPQFHPIPENDEWWGPGFTEWTNVVQGKPFFSAHNQPHLPGELGYYDLRLPEVREAQANLAREYGIHGFCYYYYWFAGRRLLEQPLEEILAQGKPDFPFCLCWANENWSRRWDGSEHEVLVKQEHNAATDEAFIRDIIPIMKDPRYIRINGAPLLLIYRVSLMPSVEDTLERWRAICAMEGIPNVYLCMTEAFGLSHPELYGFNASVQFPPHGCLAPDCTSEVDGLSEDFAGHIYSMRDVVADQMTRDVPGYKRFPGVMTSWDNTARRKKNGNVFIHSEPEVYELWLRHAMETARNTLPLGERLVFVNAWNEWAEGAHLEPDRLHGRAYLEATRRVITGQSDWRLALDHAKGLACLEGEGKDTFLHELAQHLERLTMVNKQLMQVMDTKKLPKEWVHAKPGCPFWMEGFPIVSGGQGWIDQVNHAKPSRSRLIPIDACVKLYLAGWSFFPSVKLAEDTPCYILFHSFKDPTACYFAPVLRRYIREDVSREYADAAESETYYSGFKALIDVSSLEPGYYQPSIAYRTASGVGLTYLEIYFEVY